MTHDATDHIIFFGIPFTYNVGRLDTKLSEIILEVIIYGRSFYGNL